MADFRTSGDRLAVTGSLDVSADEELRDHCRELLEGGAQTVVLDLSKVDQIASACVGSIVALWIDLRPAGRRMKITPSPAVRKALDATGLAGVFARAASARKSRPAAPVGRLAGRSPALLSTPVRCTGGARERTGRSGKTGPAGASPGKPGPSEDGTARPAGGAKATSARRRPAKHAKFTAEDAEKGTK